MKHLERARLVNTVGKIFFLFAVLFAVYEFATGVTNVGVNAAIAANGFVLGTAALIFGLFGAFLFHQVAGFFLSLAEKEVKAAEESFPGEDGLDGAFCREIRSYSLPQLRLILDEQKDEYSEKEFAYIQKILDQKTEK